VVKGRGKGIVRKGEAEEIKPTGGEEGTQGYEKSNR